MHNFVSELSTPLACLFAGEMIITSEKYQMTEINSSHYSVQMRLVIRRFNKNDIGGYKCISKNSIGDAEGNIRLYGKLNVH
jgi:neurotrimin